MNRTECTSSGKANRYGQRRLRFGASIYIALVMITGSVAATELGIHDRRALIAQGAATTKDPVRIPAKPASDPGSELVLQGGMLLDVINGTVRPATVVIAGDRIRAILPPGQSSWPAGSQVIDVSGKTVMPGLIDMHTHVSYPDKDTPIDEQANEASGALLGQRNLRYYLESGITSLRDLNGVGRTPYILSAWSAANKIPSPRVFTAGHIITGTGGHATERPITPNHGPEFAWEVNGADAWREAVRKTFKLGASVIKIASHFSQEEVEAAVDESHLLGLRVTCDCETIYIDMAVAAGVDMIEHPLPRSDEAIRQMAKKQVAAVPTLQVYNDLFERQGGYYGSTSRRFTMNSQSNFDIFKKMKAAGIVMGVGTDSIGGASKYAPNTYIAELKWFVKGGFTIFEALEAATITNARLLDMDDLLGSLEQGKLADIIVVDGRPYENLDDLARIDLVVKDGLLLVQSGALITPRHVALPLFNPSLPEEVH